MPLSRPNFDLCAANESTISSSSLDGFLFASCVDMAFVVVVADNSATSGTSPISSVTDTAGNTYVSVYSGNRTSAGVANDGVSLRVFSSRLDTALTSSDSVTVSFSTATVNKALHVYQVKAPVSGEKAVTEITGGATGSGTSATITTGSVNSQRVVCGITAREGTTSQTDDTDTTNGVWTTSLVGGPNAGVRFHLQIKDITGTGTQTYNTSWSTTQDYVHAYVALATAWVRTGTNSGTGTQTASRNIISATRRTATNTGTGTQTATGRITVTNRTATGSGVGTQTATRVITQLRSATGSGVGSEYSRWWNEYERTASDTAFSGEVSASVIPPRVVAQGSIVAVTTGNLTVTLPTHQADDILVVTVVGWVPNSTGTATMSLSGWDQLHSQTTGSPIDGEWAIWWKRAASGSETNPTITRPSGWDTGANDTAWAGRAYTVRNAIESGNPYDEAVESAIITTANGNFPAVTVSGMGRSVYQFYVSADNQSTGTAPSGWTAEAEALDSTGTDSGFRAFYQLGISSSTSTIASTVNSPAQGGYVFFGVSFKPPVIVTKATAQGSGFSSQTAIGSVVTAATVSRTGTGSGSGTSAATRARFKGFRVWTGTTWTANNPKVWNGGQWVSVSSVKKWDGSQWVNQ